MATTYTPIATQTLASPASSILFSSIPQTYTDLILVANAKGSGATVYPQIYINGSGANFARTWLTGDGATPGAGRSADNYIVGGVYANSSDFAMNTISHFLNYSNATTFKTVITRGNNAQQRVDLTVNLCRYTTAISSITYYGASNFDTGSTFTLYGILAA